MIIVDKFARSLVIVSPAKNRGQNRKKHERKVWYNKKGLRSGKMVRSLYNFMAYELSGLYGVEKTSEQKEKTGTWGDGIDRSSKSKTCFFVTITTMQHKTGKSDKELWHLFSLWVKDRKFDYVCTCERQCSGTREQTRIYPSLQGTSEVRYKGPTEDLHFHLLIVCDKGTRFNDKLELEKLGKLFGTEAHPALFDFEEIDSERTERIGRYINKYVTKDNGELCSLFTCRTFNASRGLTKRYKQFSPEFVWRIGSKLEFTDDEITVMNNLPLKKIKDSNFFAVYEYQDYIWDVLPLLLDRNQRNEDNAIREKVDEENKLLNKN